MEATSNGTETEDFGGLTIRWDRRVLRPRPWTVEQGLWAAKVGAELPPGPVLELFCGAGQIGLLAASRLGRDLVQVDVSPAAVELARLNAASAGVRADVRCGPAGATLEPDELFPVVLADPPWVRSDRIADFPEDPPTAVDGGSDGAEKIALGLAVGLRHLHPEGHLFLQVGDLAQVQVARDLLAGMARSGGRARRAVLDVRDCRPGGLVLQVGPEESAGPGGGGLR